MRLLNTIVAIFFVTGRYENHQAPTIMNLKDAGYTKWVHLYMKPNNYHLASVIPYKTAQ
ncbi:HAD family acid phosphatase [Candidatus Coxiella mudrowiae]|uniref:HAD family acid phosphatase n=1 Tax=Candidatus Coxiella mudrowiae TaxID=2054173 RepID=UPI00352F6FD3